MPLVDYSSIVLEAPIADSARLSDPLRTLKRATPHMVTATAVAATTVTSAASLTGAATTNYVGCWLESPDGQWRRIISFNGAGVATVDQAWSPVPAATATFRLWYPADPVVVASTTGSATTVVPVATADVSGRPARVEATGYWADPDRYMLVGASGVNLGRMALITNWDGTTFTVEAGVFNATHAIGDLFLIRKYLLVSGEFTHAAQPQAAMQRPFLTGRLGARPAFPMGSRGGSTDGFALEVQTLSAAATGATAAIPPPQEHDLLRSMFDYAAAATSTVVADGTGTANSTTHVRITNTHGVGAGTARFQIGQFVLINGEARRIVDLLAGDGTYDGVIVSPALSQIPTAGLIVFGGANYQHGAQTPQTFRVHHIERFLGPGPGRESIEGWQPTWKLEGADAEGAILRWALSGPASFHATVPIAQPTWTTAYGGRPPQATYGLPRISRDVVASISNTPANAAAGSQTGAAFTQVLLRSLTIESGLKAERTSPGIGGPAGDDGIAVVGLDEGGIRGTFTVEIRGSDAGIHRQRFEAGLELEFLAQWGNAAGGVFAVHARRIQYTSYERKIDGGRYVADIGFQVLDPVISGNDSDATGTVALTDLSCAYL